MKTKSALCWLLGLAGLLLAGCNYEVALTAKPTRKIDEHLLGVWLGGEDGKDTMVVRRFDDSTYVVSMDDDIYRAFHSDFAGTAFLSVQDLNSDSRLYLYLTAVVSADGNQLTLHMVSPKVVPEETKGRAALQKLIKANLANPRLLGEPLVFKRKKTG
ncbi:MAG TPA: hypothetical protein VGD97_08855 [Lacunisphaera sp.]